VKTKHQDGLILRPITKICLLTGIEAEESKHPSLLTQTRGSRNIPRIWDGKR